MSGAVGAGKALVEFLMLPIKNTITMVKGLGQIFKDIFSGDFGAIKEHAKEAFGGIKDEFQNAFSFKKNFEAGKEIGEQLVASMSSDSVKKKAKESGTSVGKEAGEAAADVGIGPALEGSAADLIKMAMIRVDRVLKDGHFKSKMVLQIHDELLFCLEKDEEERLVPLLRSAMENAVPLSVPLTVEGESGDSWFDAKD